MKPVTDNKSRSSKSATVNRAHSRNEIPVDSKKQDIKDCHSTISTDSDIITKSIRNNDLISQDKSKNISPRTNRNRSSNYTQKTSKTIISTKGKSHSSYNDELRTGQKILETNSNEIYPSDRKLSIKNHSDNKLSCTGGKSDQEIIIGDHTPRERTSSNKRVDYTRNSKERRVNSNNSERRNRDINSQERKFDDKRNLYRRNHSRNSVERRMSDRNYSERRNRDRNSVERRMSDRNTSERRNRDRKSLERRNQRRNSSERRNCDRNSFERRMIDRNSLERRNRNKNSLERTIQDRNSLERRNRCRNSSERMMQDRNSLEIGGYDRNSPERRGHDRNSLDRTITRQIFQERKSGVQNKISSQDDRYSDINSKHGKPQIDGERYWNKDSFMSNRNIYTNQIIKDSNLHSQNQEQYKNNSQQRSSRIRQSSCDDSNIPRKINKNQNIEIINLVDDSFDEAEYEKLKTEQFSNSAYNDTMLRSEFKDNQHKYNFTDDNSNTPIVSALHQQQLKILSTAKRKEFDLKKENDIRQEEINQLEQRYNSYNREKDEYPRNHLQSEKIPLLDSFSGKIERASTIPYSLNATREMRMSTMNYVADQNQPNYSGHANTPSFSQGFEQLL